MTTQFRYTSHSPKLTRQQETFIRQWWPMLAAGVWTYVLKEQKIPALLVDNQAMEPDLVQTTPLLELAFHLQEENPGLNPMHALEGFEPEEGLAILFYDGNRYQGDAIYAATNFVTLTADLTPPLAHLLWEQVENEQQPAA